MELHEAIAKVHEALEGGYTLDGYDLHEIHGLLCELQSFINPSPHKMPIPDNNGSLLGRAASLVGNPGTNISGSTDLACDEWQKDYERFKRNQ